MNKLLLYAGLLLFFLSPELAAQHYIGMGKMETKNLARESGFYLDRMTTSQKFNYLKFVNSSGTKTMIVFFDEKDIASHTRMVCDYSEYDFILEDYNRDYKKKGKTNWEYKINGASYEITLEEKEWYFVLRTKKK